MDWNKTKLCEGNLTEYWLRESEINEKNAKMTEKMRLQQAKKTKQNNMLQVSPPPLREFEYIDHLNTTKLNSHASDDPS